MKHRQNETRSIDSAIPSPPIPDPAAKDEPISLTLTCVLRDCRGQDKLITDKAVEGWEFVESLMLYGNEILMRFRKK